MQDDGVCFGVHGFLYAAADNVNHGLVYVIADGDDVDGLALWHGGGDGLSNGADGAEQQA